MADLAGSELLLLLGGDPAHRQTRPLRDGLREGDLLGCPVTRFRVVEAKDANEAPVGHRRDVDERADAVLPERVAA